MKGGRNREAGMSQREGKHARGTRGEVRPGYRTKAMWTEPKLA